MLISCVAFFTTTEADDPDLSVLPLVTALLLEAEEELCWELSFDDLLTTFDDPFTSFDLEPKEVAPLAAAVSSFGLFSAGGESLVVLSVASGNLSQFVSGGEEDDCSEAHAEASLDSGDDSVLRFLCRQ